MQQSYRLLMEFHWALLTLVHLLLGQIAAEQNCLNTRCEISPLYQKVTVTREQPGTIICTIPDLDGRNAEFVNHLGVNVHDRRRNPGISSHLKLEQHRQPSKKEVQYRLEINWTDDRQVQEQLKLLQCVANFEGSTHPCRTPVVIVDFVEVSNPVTTMPQPVTVTASNLDTGYNKTAVNEELRSTIINHGESIFLSPKILVLSLSLFLLTIILIR